MTKDSSAKPRRKRRYPGLPTLTVMAVPLAVFAWLVSGDRVGDTGMRNVYGAMLVILLALILAIWFLFCGGFRWRTRLISIGAVLLAAFGLSRLVRIEGVTGHMVPVFSSRFSEPAPRPTTVVTGRLVDLTVTSERDFPAFLGPRRDQQVPTVALDPDWASHPPEVLWRQPIGPGWSGFVVVNGIAVTQEERNGRQAVTAYAMDTGELIWAHEWSTGFNHSMGGRGPRATPAIDGGRVYAMGPYGRLVCLDGSNGTVAWDLDLHEAFDMDPAEDAKIVPYGRSGSPLIHGDHVIVPAGGSGDDLWNLAAFDKRSGAEVWRGSPHQISHASPGVGTLGGIEQILIVNESTVSGHDPATGAELWSHPWFGRTYGDASSSQAVPLPPSSVLVSKGYGQGVARLDLAPDDDGTMRVDQRWHHKRSLRTKFTNVVVRDGHAYGLSDGIFECIELENGRRKWKGGRYGHGQILAVAAHIIVLTEEGEVVLLDATPERGEHELARVPGVEGKTWNNLALSGDVLLIRNGQEAAALRLKLAGDEPADETVVTE